VWSLAWWPHAILHGENPIVSHAVWPPVWLNLAWVSSIPGLALLLAPVTLAAGAVAAYNVASILMPALAAFTAFVLCRHITRSFWPSFAGGYVFGFSSYVLGQLEGHLHMSSVFLLPLVALVVLRYVEGSLDGRGLAWRLGLLLALQLLFSTEIFFTLTLALVVTLLLAFVLVPAVRARLRTLPLPLAGGYLLACVLTAPLLAYALAHFEGESINKPVDYPADLLNVLVPTRLTALNAHWAPFIGNDAENGAYLGLPLLVVLGWFAWSRRHDPAARLLVVLLGVGFVAELGAYLRIAGKSYSPLPWKAVYRLPAFDNVLPVRLSVYVALGAAVALALWAGSGRVSVLVRIVVVGLVVATLLPRVWLDAWHANPDRPLFFTAGLYKRCLEPGEIVLPLPFPSWNGMDLWQAESHFHFTIAEASLTPAIPRSIPDWETVHQLTNNNVPAGGAADIQQLAHDQGADVILVDGRREEPWRELLTGAGLKERYVGGVYLYRPDGTLVEC
jgi:hypothetical protein